MIAFGIGGTFNAPKKNMADNFDFEPTNREKAKRAKKSLFWCSRCDAGLVGQHGKCAVCGNIENKQKIKGL
jgi:hypothetical protein